jgi:cytochrome c-type biogenesis protein CcmH
MPMTTTAPMTDTTLSPPSPRPSRRLLAGLLAFVAAVGIAGTWWLGSRTGWNTPPGTLPPVPPVAQATDGGATAPHPMATAQVQAMVDGLAARLKNEPANAEGWLMLGRSYSVLGQFEPAIAAYRHLLTLEPKNAQALADLADALAATRQGRFDGEPAQLVEQALAADGNHLKALMLAGTVAFDRQDYAGALRHWEKTRRIGPPEHPLVQQAGDNIAEARQLAGLPAEALPPMATVPPTTSAMPPVATGGPAIRGRVELAPALAARASPDDTVFVFARPAEGSRMPLAILRKQVRDLPFDFTLDDSLAMSPQARLSQATAVVVGARVSKSGQAMPQPGDLEGLSAPVAPGASGLALVIGRVVP